MSTILNPRSLSALAPALDDNGVLGLTAGRPRQGIVDPLEESTRPRAARRRAGGEDEDEGMDEEEEEDMEDLEEEEDEDLEDEDFEDEEDEDEEDEEDEDLDEDFDEFEDEEEEEFDEEED